MRKSLVTLVLAFLLIGIASSVFAGTFIGVGGDADLFPKNKPMITTFMVPALYLEGSSANSIIGIGLTLGWTDLSFSCQIGQQGSQSFGHMGIRKRIYGGNDALFSLALLWDADGLYTEDFGTYGSYLGGVVSKKFDNIYPYLGLFSTTYYTCTKQLSGSIKYEYIYGRGVAVGGRYDFTDNWSGRVEVNYNSLSPSSTLPWPKSILSLMVGVSYRF
jgi:hypothetical protein